MKSRRRKEEEEEERERGGRGKKVPTIIIIIIIIFILKWHDEVIHSLSHLVLPVRLLYRPGGGGGWLGAFLFIFPDKKNET